MGYFAWTGFFVPIAYLISYQSKIVYRSNVDYWSSLHEILIFLHRKGCYWSKIADPSKKWLSDHCSDRLFCSNWLFCSDSLCNKLLVHKNHSHDLFKANHAAHFILFAFLFNQLLEQTYYFPSPLVFISFLGQLFFHFLFMVSVNCKVCQDEDILKYQNYIKYDGILCICM